MTAQHPTGHRSLFDLPLDATDARIAELRSSADAVRSSTPSGAANRGRFGRLRDGLGVRLIDLGAALVTDEQLRRRVVRP